MFIKIFSWIIFIGIKLRYAWIAIIFTFAFSWWLGIPLIIILFYLEYFGGKSIHYWLEDIKPKPKQEKKIHENVKYGGKDTGKSKEKYNCKICDKEVYEKESIFNLSMCDECRKKELEK